MSGKGQCLHKVETEAGGWMSCLEGEEIRVPNKNQDEKKEQGVLNLKNLEVAGKIRGILS